MEGGFLHPLKLPFPMGLTCIHQPTKPHQIMLRIGCITSAIIYYVATKGDSQMAVLSWLDNKTVTVLAKTAPDMLTHTETDPSASLTGKTDCANSTCTTARDQKKSEHYDD